MSTNVSGASVKVTSGSEIKAEGTATGTASGAAFTTAKLPNGTYTVTVSKEGYEDVTKFVSIVDGDVTVDVELKSIPLTDVSVKSINANQFEVKFSNQVDKKLAETLSNYDIKDEVFTSVLNGNAKAELQEDGKTVIITRNQEYNADSFNQKTLTVKIQNIKTVDGKAVPVYEGTVNVFDNVAPTVTKIEQVSPTEFDVVFSEPVTAADSNALNSALRINNGAYSFTAKTRIDNSKLATNVIRITTNSTLAEGKYTLNIKEGLTDYAGFKVTTGDHEFTVTKDTSAITAAVSKVTKNEVHVEFNKIVKNFDDSNVKFNLDYATNDAFKATSVKADPENEKGIIVTFVQPVTPQSHSLILAYTDDTKKKIEDSYGNTFAAQTLSFSVLADNVAPTAKAEYNKNTKKVEITFSETVQGAKAIDAYELVDANGNKVNISEVSVKANTNELVYELTPSKPLEGTYTVKILANKIKDESFEENKLAAVSLNIGVADSTAPTVGTVTYGGKDNNKIFIPYSEAMKTSGEGSVLDKNLYKVNDTKLTEIEGAKLELGNDNKSVIITLPTANSAANAKVTIGRVADVSDNYTDFKLANDVSATNDGAVSVLAGSSSSSSTDLDTSVIGDTKNVQILDHKTAVFYLDRTITAVDASKITVNSVPANSAVYTNVKVKLADGTYTTVAKVTASFADNTFKTDATINTGTFNVAASAFVTSLGTTSASPSLSPALEDKAAPVIAKKSNTDLNGDGDKNNDDDVIASETTSTTGYVNTITVKLSEDMKAISAEGSSAAALVSVDGYKVTKVEIKADGLDTLTITVEPIDKETASQTPKVTLGKLEDANGNVLSETTTTAFDNTAAKVASVAVSNSKKTIRINFTEAMKADDLKADNFVISGNAMVNFEKGTNNKYVIVTYTDALTSSSVIKTDSAANLRDANGVEAIAQNANVYEVQSSDLS